MLLYHNMFKKIFLIFISTILISNASAKNLPEGYPECWQDTDNPVNINVRPLNQNEANMGQSKDLFLPQNSKVGHKFILVDFTSPLKKAQIDWIPLALQGVRPTQGKTLAIMQVCGGSQSFNAVNQMRILGRWMRMVTIPNQSSVAKAWMEFDDNNRMKPSSYYDRIVDVMEELTKFTLLLRDNKDYFVDRYSERKESAEEFRKRVDTRSI